MAVLFGKKKNESEKEKKGKEKSLEKPAEKKLAVKKEKKEKSVKKNSEEKKDKKPEIKAVVSRKEKTKNIKMAGMILDRPQITEKAAFLQEKNQYIFQVFKTAAKPEVKKAVEEIYKVDVEKVRIINVDRKRKRLGRTTGWKKGYKKAIVSVKKGQEIEILPR